MAVYVDEIQHYPQTKLPYKNWCHMACDGDLEELHAMAEKIGLKRSWFQKHPTLPHYDLVPSKRALAIRYGAIAIPATDLATKNFEAHKPGLWSDHQAKE